MGVTQIGAPNARNGVDFARVHRLGRSPNAKGGNAFWEHFCSSCSSSLCSQCSWERVVTAFAATGVQQALRSSSRVTRWVQAREPASHLQYSRCLCWFSCSSALRSGTGSAVNQHHRKTRQSHRLRRQRTQSRVVAQAPCRAPSRPFSRADPHSTDLLWAP